MDITHLLTQPVLWEKVSSTSSRDDPTYAAPVTLYARSTLRLRDLIGRDGEVTTSTNQVILPPSSTVGVADLLDGRMVIALEEMVSFDGKVVGVRALTR